MLILAALRSWEAQLSQPKTKHTRISLYLFSLVFRLCGGEARKRNVLMGEGNRQMKRSCLNQRLHTGISLYLFNVVFRLCGGEARERNVLMGEGDRQTSARLQLHHQGPGGELWVWVPCGRSQRCGPWWTQSGYCANQDQGEDWYVGNCVWVTMVKGVWCPLCGSLVVFDAHCVWVNVVVFDAHCVWVNVVVFDAHCV